MTPTPSRLAEIEAHLREHHEGHADSPDLGCTYTRSAYKIARTLEARVKELEAQTANDRRYLLDNPSVIARLERELAEARTAGGFDRGYWMDMTRTLEKERDAARAENARLLQAVEHYGITEWNAHEEALDKARAEADALRAGLTQEMGDWKSGKQTAYDAAIGCWNLLNGNHAALSRRRQEGAHKPAPARPARHTQANPCPSCGDEDDPGDWCCDDCPQKPAPAPPSKAICGVCGEPYEGDGPGGKAHGHGPAPPEACEIVCLTDGRHWCLAHNREMRPACPTRRGV